MATMTGLPIEPKPASISSATKLKKKKKLVLGVVKARVKAKDADKSDAFKAWEKFQADAKAEAEYYKKHPYKPPKQGVGSYVLDVVTGKKRREYIESKVREGKHLREVKGYKN